MKMRMQRVCVLSAWVAAVLLAACSRTETKAPSYEGQETVAANANHSDSATFAAWDPKSAAAYLDQRESWWMSWEDAARDHGTLSLIHI